MDNKKASLIEGAVYGMAYGDAWGNGTEFMPHSQILKTRPVAPEQLVITDDTQMSIYNVWAVNSLIKDGIGLGGLPENIVVQDKVRKVFADHHGMFCVDPDNNRAPGATCMSALYQYLGSPTKTTGREGNSNYSNGCGTVMRAPWLGLYSLPRETIALLSILQAQTTHGDPNGWVCSAVAALTVSGLMGGEVRVSAPEDPTLFSYALELLDEISNIQSNLIVESLPGVAGVRAGLGECLHKWDSFVQSPHRVDVNQFFGEGWVADQALFNALAVANLYAGEPLKGVERLVYSNGDSDSIAAVGGAFLGVMNGCGVLDGVRVPERLEPRYREELAGVVSVLVQSL